LGRITPHPWAMLIAAVIAQAATIGITATPAFLIPFMTTEHGMSLAEAGLIVAAPTLGCVLTLVPWGAAADRWGERRIMLIGLAATIVTLLIAMLSQGFVWLGLALILVGATSACTNSASGALISGWFPPERRGLAMGIRQTCQPIGVGVTALVVPTLANVSIAAALAFSVVFVAVGLIAVACTVVDPPRRTGAPTATGSIPVARNPYRGSSYLIRVHAATILLIVPQFTLSTFGLVWFIVGFGWSELAAGLVVAIAQLCGAIGRVVVGGLSDRVGSRLGPLRWVAVSGIATMVLLGFSGVVHWPAVAAVAFIIATTIAVADNGLAFTAVAEAAGPLWSGRALGIHNTGQYVMSAVVPPTIGALIAVAGYPLAFMLVGIAPAIAALVAPNAAHERQRHDQSAPHR